MGWGSAGKIIEPMIKFGIAAVESEEMSEETATNMLVPVIQELQESDWDTEDETLGDFLDHAWVVRAFEQCNVVPYVDLGDTDDLATTFRRWLQEAPHAVRTHNPSLASYLANKMAKILERQ